MSLPWYKKSENSLSAQPESKEAYTSIDRFQCPQCGSLSVKPVREEPVVTGTFIILSCEKCGKEFGRFVGKR
jgi:transcription elongation factor Elf1